MRRILFLDFDGVLQGEDGERSSRLPLLENALRVILIHALEGFTQTFRKRFQVPDEAASIADRICQKRHHDWIEAYLVNLRPAHN